MASKKQAAIGVSNLELQAELDRLSGDLHKLSEKASREGTDITDPDSAYSKRMQRFMQRSESGAATKNILKKKSRKRGGKIMQGYKAGGKV